MLAAHCFAWLNARSWHVSSTSLPALIQHAACTPYFSQSASVLQLWPYSSPVGAQNVFQLEYVVGSVGLLQFVVPGSNCGSRGNLYLPQFEKQATVPSSPSGLPLMFSWMT